MRIRLLLACVGLAFCAGALAQGTARGTLVCMGNLSKATRPDWGRNAIEFTLEYAQGMQLATLKSNFDVLSGPLILTMDDAYLHAKQSQPKLFGSEDRRLGISELRVSRSSGQFSLAVALYRNLDVPDGGALWEGVCNPKEAVGRKF